MSKTFDAVILCTGHHSQPYLPRFEGQDTFAGQLLHSHDYRSSQNFEGKRVVVVGIGNSAVDIAVDLSKAASQVTNQQG